MRNRSERFFLSSSAVDRRSGAHLDGWVGLADAANAAGAAVELARAPLQDLHGAPAPAGRRRGLALHLAAA